jgi:hypothetical protein
VTLWSVSDTASPDGTDDAAQGDPASAVSDTEWNEGWRRWVGTRADLRQGSLKIDGECLCYHTV